MVVCCLLRARSAKSFQTGNQLGLSSETDHLILYFAILKENESRNIADPKPEDKPRTVVHIDSRDFELPAVFLRDLIQ